jgi:hypothetical protein
MQAKNIYSQQARNLSSYAGYLNLLSSLYQVTKDNSLLSKIDKETIFASIDSISNIYAKSIGINREIKPFWRKRLDCDISYFSDVGDFDTRNSQDIVELLSHSSIERMREGIPYQISCRKPIKDKSCNKYKIEEETFDIKYLRNLMIYDIHTDIGRFLFDLSLSGKPEVLFQNMFPGDIDIHLNHIFRQEKEPLRGPMMSSWLDDTCYKFLLERDYQPKILEKLSNEDEREYPVAKSKKSKEKFTYTSDKSEE